MLIPILPTAATMSTTTSDGGIDFALYRYTPSIVAAAIFAVIFLVITFAHGLRLWRHGTYFFVPFIIGLLCENPMCPALEYASD